MHSGMIIINEELENTTNCMGMVQISKSDNFMKGQDRIKYGKQIFDTITTKPKEAIIENRGGRQCIEYQLKENVSTEWE